LIFAGLPVNWSSVEMVLLVGMCVAELDSGYFHIGMLHLDGIVRRDFVQVVACQIGKKRK
jgi:hypothetical protein